MLLILTPNPAIDRTLLIPGMVPGGVYRAERVLVAAGGKGLNVARAAHSLGQPLRVCAPLGGLSGQMLAQLATEEGISGRWSWYEGGETRTCVLVVDPTGSDATALNDPGPPFASDAWQAFAATALDAATTADLVLSSGSLPPGVPPHALADLLRDLAAAGQRVLVDTSGAALRAALSAAPYGIKVNGSELGAVLNRPVTSIDQAAAALADLRARGIALAMVSLGAQGALAATDEGVCHAEPPAIQAVSTIGAGDSLLAGLATGLLRGEPLPEALRLGVACGAADALSIGGGLLLPGDLERLHAATHVRWLMPGPGSS
jgi:1-phosphofructokinase family hexose kinase